MKLTEAYKSLSDENRNMVLLAIIGVLGALICFPLCLLPEVGFGGAIGFIAGSCLEIFSYFSIVFGSRQVLSNQQGKGPKLGLAVFFYLIRFACIAGLLVLAAFCTFSWKAPFLNFWTCFVALLPVYPLLIATGLLSKKKGAEERK